MAYPIQRQIREAGIRLSELPREWSVSTWSRLLNAKLAPEPPRIRQVLEEFLRGRGVRPNPMAWLVEPEPNDNDKGEWLMRGQALRDDARAHFRLFRSPFEPEAIVEPDGTDKLHDLYLPPSHKMILARLVQAFTGAGFVALNGEPGTGKSTLLEVARRTAAERKSLIVVTPANVERRKLTAMHIGAEIIRQLSEQAVPRTANLRDHVALEVLRQHYRNGYRVALVIDEAHELPNTTLKDLKRYHEMSDSYIRLLAVILVGQTELAQRFELERNHQLREAIIRCQLMTLEPLRTRGDVRAYMQTRFRWVGADLDAVWEPEAVAELERRLAEHDQQIPVLIGNIATAAMNVGYARGEAKVTAEEIAGLWSAAPAQQRAWGIA